MNAKLSPEQFDQIAQLSFPSYLLKMNHVCIDRCSINLIAQVETDPVLEKELPLKAKKAEDLLYLSDREALCIETCSRMYIRQTHSMLENFKKKLTY